MSEMVDPPVGPKHPPKHTLSSWLRNGLSSPPWLSGARCNRQLRAAQENRAGWATTTLLSEGKTYVRVCVCVVAAAGGGGEKINQLFLPDSVQTTFGTDNTKNPTGRKYCSLKSYRKVK